YLPISWIYHNIRCPHRLRGPQGVSGDGRENGQNRTLSMRPVRLRP
ncbi:hypothetical protein CBH49_004497, partial [Salmonella enterica subsp. enterica serovar Chester]|nr:hypothetical protein [Salmonella enterica subsp. enterica serovar Chester]